MLTKLSETVRLSRDCEGILIPDGTTVILPAGDTVLIKQSLGGDYTVRTDCGDQVRIAGEDADALGKEPVQPAPAAPDGPFDEKAVMQALKKVYDPEIPLNVVSLGLIYDCKTTPTADGYRVDVEMTLTAPGCGMGEVLKKDVERKVKRVPGVKEVNVTIVFDPPWSRDRMSAAAKLQLGML